MTNIQYNSGAIDAPGCVSSGWELIKNNYWMYLGITLLAWVMMACIPIANFFLFGPVMVGVYYVLLREMRGEPVEFGMMFKGFEKFVPAMAAGLIQNIPGIIFQIFQFTFDIGSRIAMSRPGRGVTGVLTSLILGRWPRLPGFTWSSYLCSCCSASYGTSHSCS